MDRETKSLKTPNGKDAVLKTYLTARERNAIRSSFLEGVKLNASDLQDPEALKKISLQLSAAEITEANEHAVIEQIVASYDGSNEKVLERLLDGSPEDYDFAFAEASKIGNFQRAK